VARWDGGAADCTRALDRFHFSSYAPGSTIRRIHHFQRRSDVIYLRRDGGRFLIVKPGLIFENTDSMAPPPPSTC
jgi:hypothetical protein